MFVCLRFLYKMNNWNYEHVREFILGNLLYFSMFKMLGSLLCIMYIKMFSMFIMQDALLCVFTAVASMLMSW